MFEMMRHIASPAFWGISRHSEIDRMRLESLGLGCTVGFGFMPQAALAGKRLKITSLKTYLFDGEALASFMFDEPSDSPISMIVASGEGEPYLAISRPITLEEQARLFGTQSLAAIIHSDNKSLKCREGIAGYRGWVADSYTKVLEHVRGQVGEGDYRIEKMPDGTPTRYFDYWLLVSDNNEHAIEIEKYDDGEFKAYATIYRRATDVGQISPPPALFTPRVDDLAEFKAKERAMEVARDALEKNNSTTNGIVMAVPVSDAPARKEKKKKAKSKEPVFVSSTVTSSEAPVPPTNGNGHADVLECDAKVAARIIDEASRNQITLSELVRKVIDLPVSLPEKVQIALPLSDEEYAKLALRYDMELSNRDAIRLRILEELAAFSGVRS